jgi:hypothetical protein
MPTLVSVFGVAPRRIGGTEMFARELSAQLNASGWRSVLCFLSEPTEEVRRFLELPNVSFEVLENSTGRRPAGATKSWSDFEEASTGNTASSLRQFSYTLSVGSQVQFCPQGFLY